MKQTIYKWISLKLKIPTSDDIFFTSNLLSEGFIVNKIFLIWFGFHWRMAADQLLTSFLKSKENKLFRHFAKSHRINYDCIEEITFQMVEFEILYSFHVLGHFTKDKTVFVTFKLKGI